MVKRKGKGENKIEIERNLEVKLKNTIEIVTEIEIEGN